MNISPQCRSIFTQCVLALFIPALPILEPSALSARAATHTAQSVQTFSQVDALGLSLATASQLKQALEAHDYVAAERSLLTEIRHDPHSPQAALRLQFLGGVYFLDHDAWGAAIAWNKAKAITPLPPALAFSLAMAYIRIGHSPWARQVLEALASEHGKNALYPYWLGRLDYDADRYDSAILQFQKAIQLAPDMAPAYNNLGLCYSRQNRNQLASVNYQKAIDLNLKSGHPDAWPYLNLAVTERVLNQRSEAEAHLREAIRLNPNLALAHFQLGNILEESGQTKDAINQFQTAARLDPGYAEPHYALARIYRKLGDMAASKREVKTYLRLHSHPQAHALHAPLPAHP
ncbi:MAG TPA: tetratricopeptide repeat protein [Acidobacteriaceae bacterium]|nr:tetratricopeptide repeat protein [Acidobacteriaceae bacterium]